MSALLAAVRSARWPFLALVAAVAGSGCAVYRLARWPLLVFAVAASVGCGTFNHNEDCGDDGYDDYAKVAPRPTGGMSPSKLNARPGYFNG